MKNSTVSLFDGFKNPKPQKSVNLLDYLMSDSHKDIVMHIRKLTDKDEIRNWKAKLPCITVSGQFESRHANKLIAHSGYICIDIDGNDNQHIQDFIILKNELKKIKNIAYASLSVSGNGVYCLVPIQDTENHKEHFEALKVIFKKLGIVIDKGCGDVSRLRCYSYDPDAYFNESAEIFKQKYNPKNENIFKENSKTKMSESNETHLKQNKVLKGDNQKNHSKVLAKIIELNNKEIDITKDYDDWLKISSAFANEFGEEGRELFHMISQNNVKYKKSETDAFFSKRLDTPYGYNIGTFFHLVKEALKIEE